jgi:aminoglycoside 2'-N-acetyltransferase I
MLRIEIVKAADLTTDARAAIVEMCNRAYEEDLAPLFATFHDATHLLGFEESALVSHAMWVTRWLQPGNGPLLRTAYVEMVATDPDFQGRGFASEIMRHLAVAITDFDLGGLSPAETSLYTRLGWRFWRGPLAIRTGQTMIPTPEEQIMILLLPKTPALELDAPLSAEWRDGELW